MKPTHLSLYLVVALALLSTDLFGQMREWTSAADPTKKIQGKLVRVEGEYVILQLATGKAIKFELAKLSEADRVFAKTGKEPEPPKPKPGPMSPPDEVLLSFVYDESPDEVFVRLKNNRGIRGGVNEILRGRAGLNDMYHIEKDGVRYGIYFEFGSGDTGLVEVSLQSKSFSGEEYEGALQEAWKSMRDYLFERYDKPALEGLYPLKEDLGEGGILSTDLWKTPKGEIYLGIGRADGKYSCVLKTRKTSFLDQ